MEITNLELFNMHGEDSSPTVNPVEKIKKSYKNGFPVQYLFQILAFFCLVSVSFASVSFRVN